MLAEGGDGACANAAFISLEGKYIFTAERDACLKGRTCGVSCREQTACHRCEVFAQIVNAAFAVGNTADSARQVEIAAVVLALAALVERDEKLARVFVGFYAHVLAYHPIYLFVCLYRPALKEHTAQARDLLGHSVIARDRGIVTPYALLVERYFVAGNAAVYHHTRASVSDGGGVVPGFCGVCQMNYVILHRNPPCRSLFALIIFLFFCFCKSFFGCVLKITTIGRYRLVKMQNAKLAEVARLSEDECAAVIFQKPSSERKGDRLRWKEPART